MASSAGRILLCVLAGACGALIEGFITHRGLPSTRSLLVFRCAVRRSYPWGLQS